MLRGEEARARFSETEGFISAGLHLLHHENPEEHEQDERSEIDEETEPVGVLNFLVIVEDVVVLQGFGDVGDRGIGDGDAAEFSAFAIFAL